MIQYSLGRMLRRKLRFLILISVVAGVAGFAAQGPALQTLLPIDDPAIHYQEQSRHDPGSLLEQKTASGQLKLKYDPTFGYVPSILEALGIPVSSQVLVFSKTSFQSPKISPRMPRAVYFNDDAYVGFVHGGDYVEIVSIDPQQGPIFYTVDQEKTAAKPFERQNQQCLQCHYSGSTAGVPGLLVRSVVVDRSGNQMLRARSYVTDHRSPLSERWGGWYVTGTHGAQEHMGNNFVENGQPDSFDRSQGANVTDLSGRFDTGSYLSGNSDIVALMVLEHQTRMQNLITRLGFETRLSSASQADSQNETAEELLHYMFFTDEIRLTDEIKGTSKFAEEYQKAGRRDAKGRSLRDLDLKRRLLKYPCSPLIYSRSFDALPDVSKQYLYRRMAEILNGRDSDRRFAKLSPEDRSAIREILIETKPDLKRYL